MKRLIYPLAAALMLMGAAATQADSRDRHFRDPPAWSHHGDHVSDHARARRDFRGYHGDSRHRFRNRSRHDGPGRWHRHHGRDHHRHWHHGRDGYQYWRHDWRDDYRYRPGGYRHFGDRSYGDLQVVLNVPLW